MRGEDANGTRACFNSTWITPACAGKTTPAGGFVSPGWDHPRMRGEDRGLSLADPRVLGSPPHARGRLAGLRGHDRKVGITPACAGKTSTAPKT